MPDTLDSTLSQSPTSARRRRKPNGATIGMTRLTRLVALVRRETDGIDDPIIEHFERWQQSHADHEAAITTYGAAQQARVDAQAAGVVDLANLVAAEEATEKVEEAHCHRCVALERALARTRATTEVGALIKLRVASFYSGLSHLTGADPFDCTEHLMVRALADLDRARAPRPPVVPGNMSALADEWFALMTDETVTDAEHHCDRMEQIEETVSTTPATTPADIAGKVRLFGHVTDDELSGGAAVEYRRVRLLQSIEADLATLGRLASLSAAAK